MRTQYKEELDGLGTLLKHEDLVRVGARQMLAVALEAEITAYVYGAASARTNPPGAWR
jgi:hypothetical protein